MKKLIAIAAVLTALSTFSLLPGLASLQRSGAGTADSTEITVSGQPEESADLQPEISDFDKAVEIIKKYEGLHQPRHWPLIGYGHKVLPGEKYNRSRPLSEAEAEKLLRKDLQKNCALFREYGADSLLLGTLAYNIGSGAAKRSAVAAKLKAGNRDIRESYLSHSRYRGKVNSQLKKRRTEEFEALFITTSPEKDTKASNMIEEFSLPVPFAPLESLTHKLLQACNSK